MFCKNCGKEIADGVKFCPECGVTQTVNDTTSGQGNISMDDTANKIVNAVSGSIEKINPLCIAGLVLTIFNVLFQLLRFCRICCHYPFAFRL